MKLVRIIICAVSIVIAFALPSLAQINKDNQNAETVIGSCSIDIIDPLYLLIGNAIFSQDNERIKELITSFEGYEEYLSEVLTNSHNSCKREELPPLLTLSMLVSNAEAFDLIYKNISGGMKVFALEEALRKFPKESKIRDNIFAQAIQNQDVFIFMSHYTEAEANGTIIEELTNALMEFEKDDVSITLPQR